MIRDIGTILLSSRPISWINTAFPFGAAYLMVTREIDATFVIGVLFFLIPYNLAMYGINDVFDYASDIANPRKGGIEGALLQPRLHKATIWAAALSSLPFVVALVWLGNPWSWFWLAISLFAVVAYSAPGLRFKEKPFLDSITSATHFVSPAVVGLAMAGASLSTPLIITLGAFFVWGMAAHAFGAVQDVVPDREGGISSIATVIGPTTTVRIAVLLWGAAGFAMLAVPSPGSWAALVAVPYIINAAPFWNVTDSTAASTNRAWKRFIWLNYIAGFIVTMILIAAWFGWSF